MNNILITGGAGFVGYHLIKSLREEYSNSRIVSIDNYLNGSELNHLNNTKYISGSTKNLFSILEKENFKPDIIFHLGEYSRIVPSFSEINEVISSNIQGTAEVLKYCLNNKVKLVYAASSTKYQETQDSPYTFTKSYNVEQIKKFGNWFNLDYRICYFYNNFGEHSNICRLKNYQTVIGLFEENYKLKKPMTIFGTGQQKRAFTYVGDTVQGMIATTKLNDVGEFQLTNRKLYTLLEVAKMFSNDIEFLAPRPDDRETSVFSDLSTNLTNWTPKIYLEDWVRKFKEENNELY